MSKKIKEKKQKKEKAEKKERHNPIRVIKNLWFMLQFVFKYTPGYAVITVVEALGRGASHVIGILFTKYIFDAIEAGTEFGEVLFWILLVTGYNAAFELFNKWRYDVFVPRVKLTLHETIQTELYKKARELDQSCYDDPEFYNDFIWAIRESDGRVAHIVECFSIMINRVTSSAAVLGLLASMDWVVTLILIASVILGFVVKSILNKIGYKHSVEANPIWRKLGYFRRVFYMPDYAKELRCGGIAEHLQNEYKETNKQIIACSKKYNKKYLVCWIFSDLLVYLLPSVGITSYLVVRYITDATLSLGSFSASISASQKLYYTLDDIGNYINKFHEHSLYIEKVKTFMQYEPKIKGKETEVPAFESLTVKNLDFVYPFTKDEKKTLQGLNLEIKKGEKVAFVGYNGAGKTTLIKLLMRLYDTTNGEILYNGRNITDFDPEKYREHIGAVFQDYKVFAATVAENVMGGEYTDADEEAVMSALRAASFDEKLKQLPNGIQSQLTTEFSKEGVGLSGGESQKIAIARVFARPFELIIMDEPSSALDPIAEYELNQSILKNAEGKTVIFISHRLSTTRMADKIYMFDGGEIVERGSHDELMAQNGKYAEMYRVQAKKYQTAS
ncbi:MAG: ABC transporter ATP-binding protein [Ruminococcaceae bacterium]|nr:ABC transporter ATP-binding protein [Oscillospiraceae bacterium]